MLEVRNLSRSYDSRPVLQRVSLTFQPGSFTLIAGPNGSGKTQLMKHLNGLLKPQEGEVLWEGRDIHQNLQEVRQKVGLVFQNPDSQMVGQTVGADLSFGPENLRWSREEIEKRVTQVSKELGLNHLMERSPYSLSGGEKRRCTLGAVLVMAPQVIVLDEPFNGLDLPGVQTLLRDILRCQSQGRTIILITHDLEKALAHADNLVLMNRGQINHQGSPGALLSQLEKDQIYRPWGGKDRPLESMTWLRDPWG